MNEYINKKNNAFNEYLGIDPNSDNLNLEKVFIHETANLAESSEVSEGTKNWMNVQLRENVKIGKNCVIAKYVYIDINGFTLVFYRNRLTTSNNLEFFHLVKSQKDEFF